MKRLLRKVRYEVRTHQVHGDVRWDMVRDKDERMRDMVRDKDECMRDMVRDKDERMRDMVLDNDEDIGSIGHM